MHACVQALGVVTIVGGGGAAACMHADIRGIAIVITPVGGGGHVQRVCVLALGSSPSILVPATRIVIVSQSVHPCGCPDC